MNTSNLIKFIIALLFVTDVVTLDGQKPGSISNDMKIGRIFGKILDNTAKNPLPYATVVVYQVSTDGEEKMLEGNLTEDNGEFNIKGLPLGNLIVKINYVGNKDIVKAVKLSPPNNTEVDLGDLVMVLDAHVLNTVEITANKLSAMINLEKRTFNVDKNITAAGGTAEDILKSVPSITVDMDGGVKLRDKGTTIYVDGKPSLLSLNQIPSDQIESVEVISNPSAKYEAATTGGIVNIVMKKNRKAGYNGSGSLGIGTQDRYNGSLNFNMNDGKWNLASAYSFNTGKGNSTGYLYRTNLTPTGEVRDYFNQNSTFIFNNTFHSGRLGLDYNVNNRNTLSLSGSFMKGNFNSPNTQNYEYLSSVGTKSEYGTRLTDSESSFNRYSIETQWRKNYAKKDKSLTIMGNYSWGGGGNTADWNTTAFNGEGSIIPDFPELIDIYGDNFNNQGVFQMDFTNPISENSKIEIGMRSYLSNRDQNYLFNRLDNNTGEYVLQKNFSQVTSINENIHAAYITYSGKFMNNFAYQAGLRFEQSTMNGQSLLDGVTEFGYSYPKGNTKDIFRSLFPSLYLTKYIDPNTEIGLNFSRKIQRPHFRMLMPGVQSADRQNITIGNPDLEPEFINLAELNFNKKFGSHNWLSSIYFSNETNSLKPITRPSVTDPTVLVTTFVNGEHEITYGIDNTFRMGFGKNLEVMLNANIFKFNVLVDTFSNTGTAANAKASISYKLPANFSVQVNGGYDGNRPIPQGRSQGVAFADFALKKTMFKNGTNLTFSISDIFNSRKHITIYDQPTYVQETMRRRDSRFFRLTIQIPFGKADASIFKKQGKRPNGDDQSDDIGI